MAENLNAKRYFSFTACNFAGFFCYGFNFRSTTEELPAIV